MSNDKPKSVDKVELQQVDDEAFIESLYQQIDSEPADDDALYPVDKQLDEAILAHARKAVVSKPKVVKTKKQKWFVPLSTAASLVLVSLLVWQQKDIPISPEFTSAEHSPEIRSVAPAQLVEEQEVAAIERFTVQAENQNVDIEALPVAAPKARSVAVSKKQQQGIAVSMTHQLARQADIATKQRAVESFSQQKTEDMSGQMLRKRAATELVSADIDMGLTEQKEIQPKLPSDNVIALTRELRAQLIDQKASWRLVEQSQNSYLLSVVDITEFDLNISKSGIVEVDKRAFTIDEQTLQLSLKDKQSFKVITLVSQ